MKKLIKSYPSPVTLYVLGCEINNVKPTLSIADCPFGYDLVHLPVHDNSFGPRGNKYIESLNLHILSQEELDKLEDNTADYLHFEGFKVGNFSGDIYVDIVTEDEESILNETIDPEEHIIYQINPEKEEEDYYLRIIFPEGSLTSSTDTIHCGDLLKIEDWDE